MKKEISRLTSVFLKAVLIAFAIAIVVLTTLYARRRVEIKQETRQKQEKVTNDSIALLNRLLVLESQKYLFVLNSLDSISRKGGVLGYTNNKGKEFELYLTPKQ